MSATGGWYLLNAGALLIRPARLRPALCCAMFAVQAFKSAERRVLEAQVLQELQLDRASLDKLPRKVKEALWKGGVPAMLKAGLTQPQIQRLREQGPCVQQSSSTVQQQQDEEETAGEAAAAAASSSSDSERASSSSHTSTSSGDDGSSTQYGPYFDRQYLFVAATMPALTKGDVGTELQKWFPGALWVSGDMLHHVSGGAGVVMAHGSSADGGGADGCTASYNGQLRVPAAFCN